MLFRILIPFLIVVAIAVFTIVKTHKSKLPDSTKLILYVVAVLLPIGGLLLYYVADYMETKKGRA
jgi:hypothetical protein